MPKVAAVIGATGNLGKAVCAHLNDRGWSFDERWLTTDHPDAAVARSYEPPPTDLRAVIYLPGVNVVSDVRSLTLGAWDRSIDVNLSGAFLAARANYPALKASAPSCFITVSSIMTTHPYPGRAAYAAAKAGLEGLTRALAVEWGPDGISTHCIRLGHLSSLMASTPASDGLLEAVQAKTPGGLLIEPAAVAEYIGWLVAGGCASVSGSVIDFDPGYTINRWPLK